MSSDTLLPEKMSAAKIIGNYSFGYGNWAYDIEITNKKIIERTTMPDTLNETWVGNWRIKDDTLFVKYNSFYSFEGLPLQKSQREDTTNLDKEEMPEGTGTTKFILVKGQLVRVVYLEDGELFPEVLSRYSH